MFLIVIIFIDTKAINEICEATQEYQEHEKDKTTEDDIRKEHKSEIITEKKYQLADEVSRNANETEISEKIE